MVSFHLLEMTTPWKKVCGGSEVRPREQAREQIKPVVCTPAIDLLSSICNVGVKESMDLDFYQLNRRGDGQLIFLY